MTKRFFSRLSEYFEKTAAVLRGEADVASIFPNASDIGLSREGIYAEFLRNHLPSKCNVFLGGFIFNREESESKQLDIIITTDTTPRFKPIPGIEKSFSPIEGTLGVISIKSNIDKKGLYNALEGIASIPLQGPLNQSPNIKIPNSKDWPFKVIYGYSSIAPDTLFSHLDEFYKTNPKVPLERRPNVIHVLGKCFIVRKVDGINAPNIRTGEYCLHTVGPDIQALLWTIENLQQNAVASNHILFSYNYILQNVNAT